jgi:bifunctional DNase/RNase
MERIPKRNVVGDPGIAETEPALGIGECRAAAIDANFDAGNRPQLVTHDLAANVYAGRLTARAKKWQQQTQSRFWHCRPR